MTSSLPAAVRRLGILGGAFDPLHCGHIRVAEAVFLTFQLDHVLFIPSGRPPHKPGASASGEHRLKLLELGLAGDPRFSVSDMEIRRPETSYSVHTLEAIRGSHPGTRLFFIMGLDTFLDLNTWYQPDRILRLVDLVVVCRPPWDVSLLRGSPYLEPEAFAELDGLGEPGVQKIKTSSILGTAIYFMLGPLIEVSSSQIRRLLASGQNVPHLLPEGVQSYILSNKLYGVP